jgi:hypothetical protein
VFTKRIHVFKAGDQTSAQGVQRNFSDKDLQQVVETYNPSIHEAPLVIGHAGDNDSLPAYGWIQGFSKQGGSLYADVAFTDTAKNLVKDGHYRKVSISFYSPDSAINPHKGKWSARHLALLGASPPAVKGLEPFSFSEADGVFDFAVALAPSDIFDEELGPTLIVEKSPLEMLREKLDEVRQDVSSAVKELQGNQQSQPTEELADVAASSVTDQPEAAQMANPDAPQFKESTKHAGREGTEIAQQTADLETQFPEEEFMEQGKISRKHAKGAHGQVMQVVENVYEEAHKESTDERKAAADRAFEAKRMKKEGKGEEAKEVKRFGKEEDELIKEAKHSEDDMTDSGVQKRHGGDGGPGSADHAEDPTGRYETARSNSDGYVDRMKTGKAGRSGETDRMRTAKSSEQDRDRMHTAHSDEQDEDRMHTAKAGPDGDGFSRWAGQEDGYDQIENMDQYDAGADDYPEPNRPQTSKGTDPYGRKESATKIPVETEEGPDDTIFAVQMTNVMSDKDMRVLRQKSSDKRAKAVKTHDYLYGEPQADEMTTEDGVTTARKSMNASRTVEHAEYETDDADSDADLETLREEIGDGKKSKNRLLTPGAQDSLFDPAAIVGPDGAYAEGEYKSYKGEPKSKSKQLTPGAMDTVEDPAEITGPDGAYKEASLEQLRDQIGDGKPSKAKQLKPGAMDTVTDPAEISKKSGGVYAEEHGEKKDPYTKTGFGSTYEEGEGDDGVDEGEESYNEYSTDHCGFSDHLSNVSPMGNEYGGMGSMSQARPMGMGIQQMAEELANLKQKYAELENRNRMEKMNFRRMQMAEAIGHMYTEGRLTDGIMPEQELLSYVEGLEFGTLEFSEGETAATKLLALLSKLPPMVSFGEVAGGTFQYAEEDLDPHAKALRMVEESEGKMDYVEALKKTMFQG